MEPALPTISDDASGALLPPKPAEEAAYSQVISFEREIANEVVTAIANRDVPLTESLPSAVMTLIGYIVIKLLLRTKRWFS